MLILLRARACVYRQQQRAERGFKDFSPSAAVRSECNATSCPTGEPHLAMLSVIYCICFMYVHVSATKSAQHVSERAQIRITRHLLHACAHLCVRYKSGRFFVLLFLLQIQNFENIIVIIKSEFTNRNSTMKLAKSSSYICYKNKL